MEARRKNRSPKIQMPLLHTQRHKDERGKRERGEGGRARGRQRVRERERKGERGKQGGTGTCTYTPDAWMIPPRLNTL
jgi:hypothetical protein